MGEYNRLVYEREFTAEAFARRWKDFLQEIQQGGNKFQEHSL